MVKRIFRAVLGIGRIILGVVAICWGIVLPPLMPLFWEPATKDIIGGGRWLIGRD